jgi:cytoskeletal protein CcmA (bactofilin family)
MKRFITHNLKFISGEKGAVLLLTFVVMVTLCAIAISFLYMISVQTRGSGYDIVSSKALWLAEAGIQQVLYRLKNDANYRNNPTAVNGTLGDGTYSVSVSKNGSTYTLTSTGTVNSLNRKVEQTAVSAGAVPEAFNYAQHSGGDIDFKNSTGAITGNISAADEVKNEGGMTINGTITENSSVVNPSVDFTSYSAIADNTVNGNKTFQANRTYSGIWYVDGKATIANNVTINGSIIATGNIVLQNSKGITINPTSPYPALVSAGDINGNKLQNSSINGLVYAGEDITFNQSKNNTFNGTLIADEYISIQNSSNLTIIYNPNIQSNPPPYFSGGGSVTITPQKDWNEVIPAL